MVIVDASVAYKWFASGETLHEQARKLLVDHKREVEKICAPSLILYELANAWSTKTELPQKQVKLNLKNLKTAEVLMEELNFEMIGKAIDFSKKHTVSVYDASYAVFAQEKGCNFVTADSKFVAKVKLPFVKHLSDYSSNNIN